MSTTEGSLQALIGFKEGANTLVGEHRSPWIRPISYLYSIAYYWNNTRMYGNKVNGNYFIVSFLTVYIIYRHIFIHFKCIHVFIYIINIKGVKLNLTVCEHGYFVKCSSQWTVTTLCVATLYHVYNQMLYKNLLTDTNIYKQKSKFNLIC